MILFVPFFLTACVILVNGVHQILLRGKDEYIIVFMCLYLPIYSSIQSLVFQQTGSPLLVNLFQVAKELMVMLALFSFIFFKRDFFATGFKLLFIDYIFAAFLLLALGYALLPIGSAGPVERIMYYKNMALLGIMYFFGRNVDLEAFDIRQVTRVVIGVTILAFVLNLYEYFTYTHFQSMIGFSQYNEAINNKEPEGSFYLTWTFETQTGAKRFASFFSSPLEIASAVLIVFPLGLGLFLREQNTVHRFFYLAVMMCAVCSLVFSFSRSALAALFVQLLFLAFIFRFYRLLLLFVLMGAAAALYIVFWASRDLQDFIYDTITFQNSSSLGHAIEWFQGIESMISNPQGIGLAMSGNASSVDDSTKIGGENQFIIFGVQLGVFGLFLYCLLLFVSIRYSLKAYRLTKGEEISLIPFVAAAAKFGLLMPLFTSNAEIFLYVSFLSWWMVGYSVSVLYRKKLEVANFLNNEDN